MASGIEMPVMLAAIGSVDLGGDDDLDAALVEDVDDPLLGVIGAIREKRAEAADHLGQQGIGAMEVVQVTRREMKGDGIAQRIAQGMELGAQSAFAAADPLGRAVPPFAPALD